MTEDRKAGNDDPFKVGKAYTVSEAAKLAKTSPATVRRWVLGYDAPGHHMDPVFGERAPSTDGSSLQVSFLELIEIAVAAGFRRNDRVKLARIRAAHDFARKQLLTPFPFATNRFKATGGHLVHDFEKQAPDKGSGPMAFDLRGQWVLPEMVQEALNSVVFGRDGWAAQYYPFGLNTHVVVDPHFAAGRPIVEGTRVPVVAIRDRFSAGESISYLAEDYGLETSVVEDVLRLSVA